MLLRYHLILKPSKTIQHYLLELNQYTQQKIPLPGKIQIILIKNCIEYQNVLLQKSRQSYQKINKKQRLAEYYYFEHIGESLYQFVPTLNHSGNFSQSYIKTKMIVSIDTSQFISTIQDLLIQIDNYILKDQFGSDTFNLKKCLKNFKQHLSFQNSLRYLFTSQQFHNCFHFLQQSIESQLFSNNELTDHIFDHFGQLNDQENLEKLDLNSGVDLQYHNPLVEFSYISEPNQSNLSNQLVELKKLLLSILDMKSQQLQITKVIQQCFACKNENCKLEEQSNLQNKWTQYKKAKRSQYQLNKKSTQKKSAAKQINLFLIGIEQLTEKMNKFCKQIICELTSFSDISCVNSKNTEKKSLLTQMIRQSFQKKSRKQQKSLAEQYHQSRMGLKKKSRSHRTILMEIQSKSQNLKRKQIIPKRNCGSCSQCIIF